MQTVFKTILIFLLSVITLHAEFLASQSAQALKEKKLVLLTIESATCPYCKQMKREIFSNAAYQKTIDQRFVHVYMDVSDPALPADFQAPYVPANAILSPVDGKILDAYAGYVEPKAFMNVLEEAYRQAYPH